MHTHAHPPGNNGSPLCQAQSPPAALLPGSRGSPAAGGATALPVSGLGPAVGFPSLPFAEPKPERRRQGRRRPLHLSPAGSGTEVFLLRDLLPASPLLACAPGGAPPPPFGWNLLHSGCEVRGIFRPVINNSQGTWHQAPPTGGGGASGESHCHPRLKDTRAAEAAAVSRRGDSGGDPRHASWRPNWAPRVPCPPTSCYPLLAFPVRRPPSHALTLSLHPTPRGYGEREWAELTGQAGLCTGPSPGEPQGLEQTQEPSFRPTGPLHLPIQILSRSLYTDWPSQKLDGIRDLTHQPQISSFPRCPLRPTLGTQPRWCHHQRAGGPGQKSHQAGRARNQGGPQGDGTRASTEPAEFLLPWPSRTFGWLGGLTLGLF